jgi:glyoxylase-like metal-dependent hydrolase (beta-lactamase superfamily II)/rhodanese-related sulfurtransferase
MNAHDDAALEVVAIDTANLGDRSYVVGSGGTALVVDPQRDIDRVEEILAARGWSASHVIETHFHNDYVSGGLELARRTGAEYVVPSGMDIAFTAHQVSDKAELDTGVGLLRVLLTPGHTPNHLSYAVNVGGTDLALFTGGSMLYGSVGRPDLLGPEMTEPLAHAQWNSMRRLRDEVSHTADLYPTHGFGSFCSATATVGTASTLAQQIASNPAFAVDEDTFVTELIAGLDAFPRYYAHMGPANQAGGGPIDLSLPKVATAADIAAAIARGEWVVDLRHRRVFAAEHVRGSFSFDVHGNAVTYLGWLIDWGTPLTLIGETVEEVALMQRELVRIGIDRPAAYAVGTPVEWTTPATPISSYPRVEHPEMAAALAADAELPMLDLRRHSEWADGHVEGAKHVPLHELRDRLDEVVAWAQAQPRQIWAYCGSGFRASIGCSILETAGVSVVHVDDDFPNAAKAGLPITVPEAHETLGEAYAD